MIPSPAEVVRFRALAAAALRLGGVVGLTFSFRAGLTWLVEGLRDKDLLNWYVSGDRLSTIIFYGMLGLGLVVGAPRWARWLLPMPDSLTCPACGYAIPGRRAPVCPECGLALPPEFRGKPAHEEPLSDSAWLARWRMGAVLPLRLVALWLAASTVPSSIQLLLLDERDQSTSGLVQLMRYLLAISLWMLAPVIAGLCIHPRLWKRLGRES
jgi:hypothetical protein